MTTYGEILFTVHFNVFHYFKYIEVMRTTVVIYIKHTKALILEHGVRITYSSLTDTKKYPATLLPL